MTKKLYIVHCVDTEGPMTETLDATFERINIAFGLKLKPSLTTLKKLQNMSLDVNADKVAIANMVSPNLLKYNESWSDIKCMLDRITSKEFRNKHSDDNGCGWVYSWHCMDHVDYENNPRRKSIGIGVIHKFYRDYLEHSTSSRYDEINWHYHPKAILKNDLASGTCYINSYEKLYKILCYRLIEFSWFPSVNRPGFHCERQDIHMFLEQWIPFDYANQAYEDDENQPDYMNGRLGDWRFSPSTWRGYNPDHNDYQSIGTCKRKIFRCLNLGSRLRLLKKNHVIEAFEEAKIHNSAILSFANHDYREMQDDIEYVSNLIRDVKKRYPEIQVINAGAMVAAVSIDNNLKKSKNLKLDIKLDDNLLIVEVVEGIPFGAQPFLAIKDVNNYYYDNFDLQKKGSKWSYTFDSKTIDIKLVTFIGIAMNGINGNPFVKVIQL